MYVPLYSHMNPMELRHRWRFDSRSGTGPWRILVWWHPGTNFCVATSRNGTGDDCSSFLAMEFLKENHWKPPKKALVIPIKILGTMGISKIWSTFMVNSLYLSENLRAHFYKWWIFEILIFCKGCKQQQNTRHHRDSPIKTGVNRLQVQDR